MLLKMSGLRDETEVMGNQHGGVETEWGISDVQVRQANSYLSMSLSGEKWSALFSCRFPLRTFAIHFKCSRAFPDTMVMKKVLDQQEGPSFF